MNYELDKDEGWMHTCTPKGEVSGIVRASRNIDIT